MPERKQAAQDLGGFPEGTGLVGLSSQKDGPRPRHGPYTILGSSLRGKRDYRALSSGGTGKKTDSDRAREVAWQKDRGGIPGKDPRRAKK